LVGAVLLLAADVDGKRYAKAPGGSGGPDLGPRMLNEAEQPEAVRQVMDVRIAIKVMARRYGMDVTPPYFIPVPFGLGTFGAFIQMRSAPANRKALFDVAVAGPLAGFVIAVPALLIGLRFSSITAGSDGAVSHGFCTALRSAHRYCLRC
jgi:membrane-associated protease RseP (regulator of RpoE activity)